MLGRLTVEQPDEGIDAEVNALQKSIALFYNFVIPLGFYHVCRSALILKELMPTYTHDKNALPLAHIW
jgi:hypothetical protein